jgi:CRP/FNR family transcriptional regulator, cyclic AMP receptor protein
MRDRRPGFVRLLSELPADLPTKLFARAKLVRLAAGKILCRAGSAGDGCYRVEDGLLKVTMVSSSGAERILEFLGQGAIVGELSTIDGLPRSATVVVVRDATLSWLSRAEFEAFAEEHPEVYKSLVKLLAHRLRDTDTLVAASSFLCSRAGSRGRCWSWRIISGKRSRPVGSSSVRRSGRTILPPWQASRARI